MLKVVYKITKNNLQLSIKKLIQDIQKYILLINF